MSSPNATAGERALLAGWGRTAPGFAELVETDAAKLVDAVRSAPGRGAIARGQGRSYGDAAVCSGGRVIRLTPPEGGIHVDPRTGTATVAGGVSLDALLAVIVPQGWFVPVTPGTRFVTVGGAIASDIHGKNHHADGSFGDHVTRLRLMLADTSVVEAGPDRDPALFWATVGGMGLTGVVLEATFRLIPIETSRMAVDTRRLTDLDALMAEMADRDGKARYSVAWLDPMATGRHLGRGVLTDGDHAPAAALGSDDDPLAYGAHRPLTMPPVVPPAGLVNRATARAFNEVWYRKAPLRRDGELTTIPAYFHPLDGVGGWNRVYGRSGFVQYQVVVPFGAEDVVRHVVEQIAGASLPIFLSVLKRFGAGNPAPLSFPIAGWTLAVDVPAGVDGLAGLLRGLDDRVLDAGGRHYLAKDHLIGPAELRRGYPRLDEWLAVRERVDPDRRWASDLARRLDLLGTPTARPPGRRATAEMSAH